MSFFYKEIFCAFRNRPNARKDRRDFRSQRGFITVSTPIIRFSQPRRHPSEADEDKASRHK